MLVEGRISTSSSAMLQTRCYLLHWGCFAKVDHEAYARVRGARDEQ